MKYKDVRIMKSDKGNTVVVMNTEDYKSKMYQLLEDENTYEMINRNFNVSTWQHNFNSSLKEIIHHVDKKVYDYSVSPKLPVIPYFYGLPKIHKVGVPMRPIVASLRAPARNLSLWLTKTLSPFIGLVSQSHLKHSLDFLDTFKEVNSNFNNIVSFDVVSLFTNVPLDKVLDFIRAKGEEEIYNFPIPVGKICELVKLCVSDTFFCFDDNIYKQTFGVAMGSSLSPVLANIYMEFFETSLLPNINIVGVKLILWKRYVDDTFALLETNDEESLDRFLESLNSQEDSIKFTLEKSQNDCIPFLDVYVVKTNNGFETKVFRKSTHTNSYIHYFSGHSNDIKRGVIVGLFLRAFRLCSPQYLDNELDSIKNSFLDLAYPQWFIDLALSKARNIYFSSNDNCSNWNKDGLKVITLPYNQRLKEITSMLDDKVHKFVFQYKNTIKKCICNNQFGRRNNEIEKGVYVINCNDCNLAYVGETGRQFKTRLEEHARAIRYNDSKSALAAHCWNENHHMNFKDSKIVYRESNEKRRRVIEGSLINSIPTVPGNKSFNNLDSIHSCLVIREANLTSLVKAANDRGLLPGTINPIQNLCAPNPGIYEEEHPLGRINIINERGQVIRRSRRINQL